MWMPLLHRILERWTGGLADYFYPSVLPFAVRAWLVLNGDSINQGLDVLTRASHCFYRHLVYNAGRMCPRFRAVFRDDVRAARFCHPASAQGALPHVQPSQRWWRAAPD